jgi:hypothetical protein
MYSQKSRLVNFSQMLSRKATRKFFASAVKRGALLLYDDIKLVILLLLLQI